MRKKWWSALQDLITVLIITLNFEEEMPLIELYSITIPKLIDVKWTSDNMIVPVIKLVFMSFRYKRGRPKRS